MEYFNIEHAPEEQSSWRMNRKCVMILIISSTLILTVIIGVVVGTIIHKRNSKSSSSNDEGNYDGFIVGMPTPVIPTPEPPHSLKDMCRLTMYPNSCYSSISSLETNSSTTNTTDIKVYFYLCLRVAIKELSYLTNELPTKLITTTNDTRVKAALTICQALFEDAVDKLNNTISSIEVGPGESETRGNFSTMSPFTNQLGTAWSDQQTCLDGLKVVNSTLFESMNTTTKNSTEYISNCKSIASYI